MYLSFIFRFYGSPNWYREHGKTCLFPTFSLRKIFSIASTLKVKTLQYSLYVRPNFLSVCHVSPIQSPPSPSPVFGLDILMDGWTDGWRQMNRWMDEWNWMDGRVDGRVDGWILMKTNEWIYGWNWMPVDCRVGGRMGRRTDGWMDGCEWTNGWLAGFGVGRFYRAPTQYML